MGLEKKEYFKNQQVVEKHPSDSWLKEGGAFDATTMCLYAYGTTRCRRR